MPAARAVYDREKQCNSLQLLAKDADEASGWLRPYSDPATLRPASYTTLLMIMRCLHCTASDPGCPYNKTHNHTNTSSPNFYRPPRSTRSSSLVTLARPSTSSSLRITDRSFQYASSRLWNQLPNSLRQPRTNLSNSDSPNPFFLHQFHRLTTLIIHHPLTFIPGLKPSFSANPFYRSLPFLLQD